MSAPVHTTLCVQQFLTKNCMTSVLYPSYLLHLAPSDLLFPRVKKILKGKCFANVEEAKPKKLQKH